MKPIWSPTYDGALLNLHRFLHKLDNWGIIVTEDMDTAQAEKYVFKRFCLPLPAVLKELYGGAAKEAKLKILKDAKIWLNVQEREEA